MRDLIDCMRDLPDNVPAFPLPGVEEFKHLMPAAAISLPKVTTTSQDDEDEDELVGEATGGTLAPRLHFPGQTNVTIRIEKIQVKEPASYIEPFFSLSVKDAAGRDLTQPQDTPITNQKDDFIHFGQNVELQKPIEGLPSDCDIFLEFKHFKPKKNKTSVKCFSILEILSLPQRRSH